MGVPDQRELRLLKSAARAICAAGTCPTPWLGSAYDCPELFSAYFRVQPDHGNGALMPPGASDGWVPLPERWVFHVRRVITRRAHEGGLAWFPVPDPRGYDGIGLALMDKTDVAREFWMWTDDSEERLARVVRLGYRRYVVELHGADGCAVLEHPDRTTDEHHIAGDEQDVLGHSTLSPARTLSSSVVAESCARMWLDHARVHDGFELGRWESGGT